MQLSQVVTASAAVAATGSRTAKVTILAQALRTAEGQDLEIVAQLLSGSLRQRRTGVGWRSLQRLPEPASSASLTVAEVDQAFTELEQLGGTGSATLRAELLAEVLSRATADEQRYLASLIAGETRQGALAGVLAPAIAAAFAVPLDAVRRAAMFAGSLPVVAVAARAGGEAALAAITLRVGRPVLPMLASSAPSVAEALARTDGAVAVETKLDGIRIQVHRDGDQVRIYSRSLDDITARLPGVVAAVAALPARKLVLDGEALALRPDGRPMLFQDTSGAEADLRAFFFDILHRDGLDLVDEPAALRHRHLSEVVPDGLRVARLVTDDPDRAEEFSVRQLAAGHEGVVLKTLDAGYAAGRRGAAWIKVKPRLTLDLVVLAAEWGGGRRRGALSNIHLGARDGDGFAMLGKTFKGMTDQMLAWQTERFLELEDHRDQYVVHLRPEQVVEVAFDSVQRSSRYPSGMALRFARVLRYRDDKSAAEADTVDTVRRLASGWLTRTSTQ